jgi:DNA gyrase subunit A
MEIPTTIQIESQERYLTYALSVVSGRALPDVRDGLKPVQRRILYAMFANLGLRPDKAPRKCAAVVGEVLARYHPHGDIACYDALVRLAQDFTMRYPLIEGQGNFGSLDGDAPAAYRYTEARLRQITLKVLGELNEETVPYRDNFDATTPEPTVLPSMVPNLLVNGSSGIAVGMATSIPPHNLTDTIRALKELIRDPESSTKKLTSCIRAPDFPSGCVILNSRAELEEIYRSGRGSVKMRGEWRLESGNRGKNSIILSALPYGVNKAQLVEKIANFIIERKVPQLNDIRDESTDEIRIVLELRAEADPESAMAYLCRYTQFESSFAVNLTVLVPTDRGTLRPELLSLRACLQHFLDFREEVVRNRLIFERKKLLERLHILEGFVTLFDALDEAIKIVRKSGGRADAAEKLQARFKLTEIQALAVVDMRIYHLSQTNIDEIRFEMAEKSKRKQEIEGILAERKHVIKLVEEDLDLVTKEFGDKRRCRLAPDAETLEVKEEDFLIEEDVYAIISKDGWLKRIRQTNDFEGTRLREGDELFQVHPVSTLDYLVVISNLGSVYSLRVNEIPSTSGFGTPVQKLFKFRDNEKIVQTFSVNSNKDDNEIYKLIFITKKGLGASTNLDGVTQLRRSGKRIAKLKDDDELVVVLPFDKDIVVATLHGYVVWLNFEELVHRDNASQGAILVSLKEEDLVIGALVTELKSSNKIEINQNDSKTKVVSATELSQSKRGSRGIKIIKKGSISSISLSLKDD